MISPAQYLWKEYSPRVKHCEYVVLGIQSKQGILGLVMSEDVPTKMLRAMITMIRDELKERADLNGDAQ